MAEDSPIAQTTPTAVETARRRRPSARALLAGALGLLLVAIAVCVVQRRGDSKPGIGAVGGRGANGVDLSVTTQHDFPAFLGPSHDGALRQVRLAREWETRQPRKLWQQPIGEAWSSFAIVGPYAVTQEQRNDKEMTVCYERDTGREIWTFVDENARPYRDSSNGSGPRSTPTIADGRVYTVGPTGWLNCLEGSDGRRIWTVNFLETNAAPPNGWGTSCSPLVVDGLVVVKPGGPNGKSVVAYRASDGKYVWGAGDQEAGYATVVAGKLAGRSQLVSMNQKEVTSHDPKDGHILWRHEWGNPYQNVANPLIVGDDRVFIASGYGWGCALLAVKAQGDGSFQVEELWKNQHLKPQLANVLLHENHIYGLDDGILVCLELEKGERKWKAGRYGNGQVLLAGELLIVLAESGEVALVDASPEKFKELGRIEALSGQTLNNPALSGPYLLVRNSQQAACFELPLAED